ncbi:hypothetical protein LR48_Vigan04g135700 [Vigna angularis]|uniref:Uncharacterized protein n=1 Tax=Phaseolus angularis TaxID=3914 RepID=A0A0L9UF39_PHAAN|nr:hypothetical protein LR48_Vigan04g135700 [Vigna angularis]
MPGSTTATPTTSPQSSSPYSPPTPLPPPLPLSTASPSSNTSSPPNDSLNGPAPSPTIRALTKIEARVGIRIFAEELDRFEAAEKVILVVVSLSDQPSRQSTSLFNPHNNPAEYFSTVDEIIHWMDQFSITPPSSAVGRIRPAIVDRAENTIQLAMSRLKEKMWHVLICNTIPLDAVSRYGSIRRVSLSFGSYDGAIDDTLESFGEVGSSRFHERDALDECLVILGVERLSIEEVQRREA